MSESKKYYTAYAYYIDIMVVLARPAGVSIWDPTLIGATTRAGMLSNPLRARFGITGHMEYYEGKMIGRDCRADR